MNKRTTSLISILLLVLLVGAFLAACGTSQTPAASTGGQPATTTLDGQTLLQERCTVCHNLDRVTSAHKTTDQWTATVEKMVLQERCTVCHNLDRVTSAHKTTDQWTATVEKMVGNGAQLNAQEKQTLVDYLAQTYP